jgi:microsomal epoxide hydrolase
MSTVKPFRIEIPQARLDRIAARLRDAVWPDIPTGDPWAFGASAAELRALVDYWLQRYDWRAREAAMNRWPQFTAQIDGYAVHFIHVRGSGDNPRPVLVTHGWPGSFVEFLKVIEPLTRPEQHGGNIEDAVSVVIPSLPGFGFSSKPVAPIGPRAMAKLFDKLMTEQLGYREYIAQGGDWGSSVSSWLGFEGVGCKAIHLNFVFGWNPPDVPPQTPEELAAFQQVQQVWQSEGGYIAIQGTKPLTLSYAMQDSPLGVAAWLLEKFRSWSALQNGDLWSVYTRDEILDNIMVYLVTETFGTASWIYRGVYDEPVPAHARIDKPTGIAHFPGEGIFLPRSQVEKSYRNIVRWTDLPAGGHFAAFEQPQLFADELRAYVRQLRDEQLI